MTAAERFIGRVRAAVDRLEALPESGSPLDDERFAAYRELIVGQYRMIYRYADGTCRIVAFTHAARDLGRVFDPDNPP